VGNQEIITVTENIQIENKPENDVEKNKKTLVGATLISIDSMAHALCQEPFADGGQLAFLPKKRMTRDGEICQSQTSQKGVPLRTWR
jgi:hypothetical protein